MTSPSLIRRLALHLLGGISALLLLATLSLWIISPWRSAALLRHEFSSDTTTNYIDYWRAESTRGVIVFSIYHYHRSDTPASVFAYAASNPPGANWYASLAPLSPRWWDNTTWYHYLGFHWVTQDESIYTNRVLILPHWLFAAIFGAPTFWWIVALRRARQLRRRIDLNLCLACGYDLRAHPPTGRCPECGTSYSPPPKIPASSHP